MAFEVEDFYDAIPDHLPLKGLGNGHTFYMRGCRSVQPMDDLAEVVYVIHAAASTKSPVLHVASVTPAAIAGVMRRVLRRFAIISSLQLLYYINTVDVKGFRDTFIALC